MVIQKFWDFTVFFELPVFVKIFLQEMFLSEYIYKNTEYVVRENKTKSEKSKEKKHL